MKKQTKIIAAVAAVAVIALAITGFLVWKARSAPKPPEPEVLPDSGALALPVVSAFSSMMEVGERAVLFADRAALDSFIDANRLRYTDDRENYSATLQVPESYNFDTHYIFYCHWPLSTHFTLRQCYLEVVQGHVSVQADYTVTDEALTYEGRLMQGYLIALDRGALELESAKKISFRPDEHRPGETEPTLTGGPLRLELLESLKPGAKAIRVRVIPAEGEENPPTVVRGLYWTMDEYRGYRWRYMPLAPGKEPENVLLEQIAPDTYDLLLDAYQPVEAGRRYRVAVQVQLAGGGGAGDGERINVVAEIEAK